MYDIENYYQAKSVKDAVRLLNEHPDARIISGGSDVLIKIRAVSYTHLDVYKRQTWRSCAGTCMYSCGRSLSL